MFSGSLVAIVTPMTADGALDWPAWDRLLDFHVREGSDGIVVAGTTGESPVLSAAEVDELTRRAVARCRNKLKVIVGAGNLATGLDRCTHTRIVAARRRRGDAGDSILQQTSAGRSLQAFHGCSRRLRGAAVILYNVPSRTAVDLLPSTIARLARHPRIVAIKEATASVSRAREIVSACPPEFVLLSGDDATAVELMGAGARGVISVTANVAPRRMHAACKAALLGDSGRSAVY